MLNNQDILYLATDLTQHSSLLSLSLSSNNIGIEGINVIATILEHNHIKSRN
ncbi:MAG: hypothetical protein AB8U25_04315 [Rickettsiales endosymbiont of Dermacentor nuttalli]